MPLSSFSLVFGHDSRPYRLRRHDLDLQTPVTELLRPGLGFGQVTFPDDAFVRFVDTLDPVLILAGTLRQFFGDFINTAVGEAAHWGQELYSLADVKFPTFEIILWVLIIGAILMAVGGLVLGFFLVAIPVMAALIIIGIVSAVVGPTLLTWMR